MLVVCLVLIAYATLWVAGLRHERAQKAFMHEAGRPLRPSAYPPSLTAMREAPEFWLSYLEGRFRGVFLTNAPVFMRGGAGFGAHGFTPRWLLYLVDTHGEVHELRRSKDEASIGADAQWLAEGLGLELTYRS